MTLQNTDIFLVECAAGETGVIMAKCKISPKAEPPPLPTPLHASSQQTNQSAQTSLMVTHITHTLAFYS